MDESVDAMPKPALPGAMHLGDGVYAGFDGWHLTLAVNSHNSYPVVFMEQEVYAQLREYAKRLGWEKPNGAT